jgi:hypothetical protein
MRTRDPVPVCVPVCTATPGVRAVIRSLIDLMVWLAVVSETSMLAMV